MPIDIINVEPGDLIFTYTGADLAIPGTPTGHVMIAGQADLAGIATQIHQVRSSMSNPYSGSQRERLVPNSAKGTGVSASRKRILRCRSRELAAVAARLALYWQRWFQLEFSETRVTNATYFEQKPRSGATALVADLRSQFAATGKFRAIKYAARRNGFLSYPDEEGKSGKGMFCSMFVAICYQIAGLGDYVNAADYTDSMLRISDKKMRTKDCSSIKKTLVDDKKSGCCKSADFEAYKTYTQNLRDQQNLYELGNFVGGKAGARQKKVSYRPSIEYWKFEKGPIGSADWARIFTKGMMVDAKIVMPRGLYDSLVDDPDGWIDLGDLTGEQKFEDPTDIKARAELLSQDMARQRQSWVKSRAK